MQLSTQLYNIWVLIRDVMFFLPFSGSVGPVFIPYLRLVYVIADGMPVSRPVFYDWLDTRKTVHPLMYHHPSLGLIFERVILLVTLDNLLRYEDLAPEAGISGRDKWLLPMFYCGMQLLTPVWYTCFWHQSKHISSASYTISKGRFACSLHWAKLKPSQFCANLWYP